MAWAADLVPGSRAVRTASASEPWYQRAGSGLTLACAILAAAPDLDLLVPGYHRSVTHSVTAAVAAGLAAALVAAATRKPVIRLALTCAAAWATHIALDWTAVDNLYAPFGVQMFWPFSDRWFISGWNLFPTTERHNILSAAAIATNAKAAATELTLLGPIVLVLWLVRVKTLAGFSSQLARGHHPPQ